MTKGIAIIAGGATKLSAPVDDPAWTMWTFNDFYQTLPAALGRPMSFSTIFEMHPASHYNTSVIYKADHEQRLAEIAERIRVVLAFRNRKIPKAVLYPKRLVIDYFHRDYFMSSLAWIIAYATMEICSVENQRAKVFAPRIGLWGGDMQLTSEYAKERACVEYWLARAEGQGIEVVIADGSPILKSPFQYGYETETVGERKKIIAGRRAELEQLVIEADKQVAHWSQQLAERRGALGELGWAEMQFTESPPPPMQKPV